jgi:hypothetical protein
MRCTTHGESGFDGCGPCKDRELEQEYAERYAVACIVYYNGAGEDTGLTDAQFDGFCDWLLKHESYKRIEWLDYDFLRCGSGYDVSKFPQHLHRRAAKLMGEA